MSCVACSFAGFLSGQFTRGRFFVDKMFCNVFFFNKTDFLFRPIQVSVVFATFKAYLKQWLVRVTATYGLVARVH